MQMTHGCWLSAICHTEYSFTHMIIVCHHYVFRGICFLSIEPDCVPCHPRYAASAQDLKILGHVQGVPPHAVHWHCFPV